MPRFVVQHHIRSEADEHWDLMFEAGEVLWTWSLPCPPDAAEPGPGGAGPEATACESGSEAAAGPPEGALERAYLPAVGRQLADHRLLYLDYEGEIEGGRGRVEIHDGGEFQWLGSGPEGPLHALDRLEFRLEGRRARGTFRLSRIPHEGKDLWRLSRLKGTA